MQTTKGLKLIGQGSFTKCYQLNSTTVLLKSTDPIKEAMACGWFPDSSLFPVVENSAIDGCYEMEFYPRTRGLKTRLDSDQWQLYKDLKQLFDNRPFISNKYDAYSTWYNIFEQLENEEVKEDLQSALDACCNFGSDINFEISPRNVAVKNGKLILLDCFFSITALEKTRK